MIVDCIVLGAYQTNGYVVRAEEASKVCLIVDAGLDGRELVTFLHDRQLIPEAVVLTHGHVDHIAGLLQVQDAHPDINVYIHQQDGPMLSDPQKNLSAMAGQPVTLDCDAVLVAEGDTVEAADVSLQVIHTPGHTPGGMCLYAQSHDILFAGDTLFQQSVGRTDFPGGSMPQLKASIKQKLFVLPDSTVVYPGHGPETSIGEEKKSNMFVR